MGHLPDELLSIVLSSLSPGELQISRLVCRRWSYNGARYMFPRLYFRPHTEIMGVFDTIIQNPVFAAGVSEIVYDTRMFLSCLLSAPIYQAAWDALCGAVMPPKPVDGLEALHALHRSHQQYIQLYHDQQRIIDARIDSQMLFDAMKRLPNLKSVQLLDDFEPPLRSIAHRETDCMWYREWSDEQFWEHSIPHSIIRGLTCLRIGIGGEEISPQDFQWAYATLFKLTHNLRSLSLRMNESQCMGDVWAPSFMNASWPHLCSLDLHGWHFSSELLVAVCSAVGRTLRELRLADIRLSTSDSISSSKDFGVALGQSLRLYCLCLWEVSITDPKFRPRFQALGWESKRHLGLDVMKWIPDDILETYGDNREFLLWHRALCTRRISIDVPRDGCIKT